MKEHDSRKLEYGDEYEWITKEGNKETLNYTFDGFDDYVDCNNFLHNINGPAWINDGDGCSSHQIEEYWIHGKHYENKQDWEIEVNRLLMLGEL